MLNELRDSVISRINEVGASPEDTFILKIIERVNNPGFKHDIITETAPSLEIALKAQHILKNRGIETSRCNNIIAIHMKQ